MDQIDQIMQDFETLVEWKAFAEQQTKTILKLQEEISHLKGLLEQNTPVIGSNVIDLEQKLSNIEIIAIKQLERLKEKSDLQELTYDECKKCSEYYKILTAVREKNKNKSSLEQVPTDNLLDFVASLEAKKN